MCYRRIVYRKGIQAHRDTGAVNTGKNQKGENEVNNYKVSVMESHMGIYTGNWNVINAAVSARNTRDALRMRRAIGKRRRVHSGKVK